VLTLDNLGEASALERRTWSPRTPLGRDPSVTQALPRLLDDLDQSGLTATFFVEAANTEYNPRALHLIGARGHELGVHGWRHEPWAGLAPGAEQDLLERSTTAFGALGLPARAFRPPGGEPTSQTETLLRLLGYAWHSPAGTGAPRVRDGLATVPFSWDLVDAYHLMDRFSDLRVSRGDAAESALPAAAADRLSAALHQADSGVQTVILHPFLMLDREWRLRARELLALISELGRRRRAWVVPGGVFAGWLSDATRE
jgi:peptidoglycan/xylan/chitin deacetylase (PgdA/CDA1 family)